MDSNELFFSLGRVGIIDTVDVALALVKDAKGGSKMRGAIEGIATAESQDQDGDEVDQDGADFSYAKEYGFFTQGHYREADGVIGEIESIEKTTIKDPKTGNDVRATRVSGFLYLHKKIAAETYETMLAMKAANSSRQVGMSIEGRGRRDPNNRKRIVKSLVHNIAITPHPAHPLARAGALQMIAKSVAASEAYNLAWGEFSKSLEPDVPVPVQQNRPVKLVSKDDIDRTLRLAQPHATDLERSKMVDILFRLTNI